MRRYNKPAWTGLWLLAGFLCAACQPATLPVANISSTQAATSTVQVIQPVLLPSATISLARVEPSATFTETPEPDRFFCSPLQGIQLDQLHLLVSNPFNPPASGSDDPHQGVDLADRQEGSQVAKKGRAVTSISTGRVAASIQDRFPYGNALLIEANLDSLPKAWVDFIGIATPAPAYQPDPALTCPSVLKQIQDVGDRSLYILYAHLLDAPSASLGELVTCGQEIGAIGDSGNALNPHLHLEARLGPAGAQFDSLAHYDNQASLAEMDAYCTWRVRGLFQLVDPLKLLTGFPEN